MKLLFVVSSLDLTQPFSATPAWWQLMKGLYEEGVEVLATPYQGPAIEALWWRAYPNPARAQGDAFKLVRDTVRRVAPPYKPPDVATVEFDAETRGEQLVRRAAHTLVAPLWHAHLDRILTTEPDIDAVLWLTVPLNQLRGVAADLQAKHGKPFLYYDGDVPASLPNLRGFVSGFRIYHGADLAEFAGFISNSAGGAEALQALGARKVDVLYYGADPDVFAPVPVAAQDIDVFFYGHGREYRERWVDAMLAAPSHALAGRVFAARGKGLGDMGSTQLLPYLSFSKLREYACRSKLNLCITRSAHASVERSSSSRPFELAALGCTIVSSPYVGLEAWFEPGKELFMVADEAEVLPLYTHLLTHDAERQRVGQAARARVLAEHTFRHRARTLMQIVRATV